MTSHQPVNADASVAEEAKAKLRASIRKNRQHRSERRLAEHAQTLRDHVLALPSVESAACVSVYASRSHEPGTLPLIESLHARGVRVLIPMLGSGLQRGWGEYHGADDLLERAPGRPPEPGGEFLPSSALAEAEVVVVPAMAVDTAGTRLGQGGGWYDRALTEAQEKAPLIALTFANEVYDADESPLPAEPHDHAVHAVITPDGITRLPA